MGSYYGAYCKEISELWNNTNVFGSLGQKLIHHISVFKQRFKGKGHLFFTDTSMNI